MGDTVTVIIAAIVTVTDADLVGSACDMAVTVTNGGTGTLAGAVYKPADVIVPQVLPLQPMPLTPQVTAVLAEPVTVALNCCCAPVLTWAPLGEMLTLTGAPVLTVTVAEADRVGSASRVAVTATIGGTGATPGAV